MSDNTREGLRKLVKRLNPGQYVTVEVSELQHLFDDLDAAHAGALLALEGVESIVEFYLKREIESPANHQEFARQAQEKLDRFRDAKMSLAASGQRAIEVKMAEARLEEAELWHQEFNDNFYEEMVEWECH